MDDKDFQEFLASVHEDNRITLSDEDRDIILEALENPPEPNEKLKEILRKAKEKFPDDT